MDCALALARANAGSSIAANNIVVTKLTYPITKPATASPEPPYSPGARRARLCAMCPQIIAGLLASRPKQTRDSTPRTKLVMAKPCFFWPTGTKGGLADEAELTGAVKNAASSVYSEAGFHSTAPTC